MGARTAAHGHVVRMRGHRLRDDSHQQQQCRQAQSGPQKVSNAETKPHSADVAPRPQSEPPSTRAGIGVEVTAYRKNTNALAQERNTPQGVVDVIQDYAPIGLDPCHNEYSVVGARETYNIVDDGMAHAWIVQPQEVVFCNAEWNNLLPWAQHAAEQWTLYGTETLFWTGFDHSTKWCHFLLKHASRLVLWGKREQHSLRGEPGKGRAPTCALWRIGGNTTPADLNLAPVSQYHKWQATAGRSTRFDLHFQHHAAGQQLIKLAGTPYVAATETE